MESKRLAIFLLIAVFFLGMLTGALLLPLLNKQHAGNVPTVNASISHEKVSRVEALSQELHLNAGQKEQLRAIVDKSRDRYHQLHEEYSPRCNEIRIETRAAIIQILQEDQKHLFEKHIERLDRARHEKEAQAAQEND